MNLVGYQVTHKAFGDGVVTRCDNKYVTVRFANIEKTFVYPTAFNGYMTLAEPSAMDAVRADIIAAQAAKTAAEESRAQERERQMRSGIVIPGGKAPVEHHDGFRAEETTEDM